MAGSRFQPSGVLTRRSLKFFEVPARVHNDGALLPVLHGLERLDLPGWHFPDLRIARRLELGSNLVLRHGLRGGRAKYNHASGNES